jgi:hypothetical protein
MLAAFNYLTLLPDLSAKEWKIQMIEAIRKNQEESGPQLTSILALYSDAANRFRSSAEAFMKHIHLLSEARSAYDQARSTSTELRNSLDAGDQALKLLMIQLEQLITDHISEPVLKKSPQLVEPSREKTAGITFP